MRIVHVAVGVIVGENEKILIAKRADAAHQGGLWEFPGGKVEQGETFHKALARELYEELNIDIISTEPLIKIRHDYGDKIVLLDVHKITKFSGEPTGNEGQPIAWVDPKDLHSYEFPAANRPIITAINLPRRLLITGDAQSQDDYIQRTERALKAGIRLIQLRVQDPSLESFPELVKVMVKLCSSHSAKLQINSSAQQFLSLSPLGDIGLHLNSKNLLVLENRPVAKNILLSASCHNQLEMDHAKKINVDFILLSPILPTGSHPNADLLGWEKFSTLIESIAIPVFALGGMSEQEFPHAIANGAQGIASISAWWNL